MARLVLVLLSVSLAFGGCSCEDDDDGPVTAIDGGNDSGAPDGSGMDSSTAADAGMTDNDAGSDSGAGSRNACGGEMCDLLLATSCATIGEGCQFLLPAAPNPSPIPFAQCEPVGTIQEGGACTVPSDCAPGLDCTANGSAGTCRQYCCNLNQKSGCPGEQVCALELSDLNQDPTGVGLCDACDACDPLDSATTCGGGDGCYPIPGSDGVSFSACTLCLASSRNRPVGAGCRSANECAPGLGCFSLDTRPAVCIQMCDLNAGTNPCPGTLTCQDRLGAASRSGAVGVCIP
jgi:hypothetical protein